MKKIIKLTELDLERIVKRVISEQKNYQPSFGDSILKLGRIDEKIKIADEIDNILSKGKVLKKNNMYDKDSETLQKALIMLGYELPNYGSDGKFGGETERALTSFQSKNDLEDDGIAGELTLTKISDVLRNKMSSKSKESKPKESKPKESKPQKSNNEFSFTSDKEYAIIKPQGYTGNRVHVLFGGSHTSGYSKNSARPDAIKKYVNVMTPYANNIIIVITHHMNSLGNVRAYVKEKFGGVVTSIAGFSQGGKETWEHAGNSSLSLVGLIDPSTYETGVSFGANTILYCDPKNWGTSGFYGQTRRRLEWYCEHKNEYSGKVVCFNKGGTHMNFGILKSFYDQYGGKM